MARPVGSVNKNTLAKHTKTLEELKTYFLKIHSTLEVVGYSKKNKQQITVYCTNCGKNSTRHACYWRKYGCYCTRAKHISETHLQGVTEDFYKRVARKIPFIKLLSKYRGMNHRIKVKCLCCGKIWMSWGTNLSRGHGCQTCSAEDRQPLSMEIIKIATKKRKQTMLRRHGVEHALQNKVLFEQMQRSSFCRKSYKLGNRVVKVQGYEPLALGYLVKVKGITPNDIECGYKAKIPSIRFVYEGKKSIYHPDIYIPSKRLLLEVKSNYTYLTGIGKHRAKRDACIAAGYRFAFLVMNGKTGERIDHRNLKPNN